MISCNTVTASSDTLGVHSHAADEGGQLAWSALAHPRLSSRARTDPRPQLSAARVLPTPVRRGHWGMSALARGVAPRARTDARPQLQLLHAPAA